MNYRTKGKKYLPGRPKPYSRRKKDPDGREKLYDVIGIQLKKLRKKHKMTRVDLAKKIGCDRRYIEHIEHGTRCPSIIFVDKILEALNADAIDLLAVL